MTLNSTLLFVRIKNTQLSKISSGIKFLKMKKMKQGYFFLEKMEDKILKLFLLLLQVVP